MQSIRNQKLFRQAGLALPAVLLLCTGLTGCSNTISGAGQDVSNDAAKTAQAAANAGNAVKDVPHDIDAAAAVTPEVKTAIVRDPVLNDPHNVINVNSHDHITHLTGHVADASMKQRATEDAQTVLSRRHPNYKVSNELKVAAQ